MESNNISHYVSTVRPLAPQTAPLPISDRHVAPTPWKGLPPRFAQSEAFVAPPKFGLIVVVPPTIANWLSTIGANAVRLKYAAPDFVNQVRPTLAALPGPAGFELTFRAPNAQPQRYAPTDFSGPAKFGLLFVPTPSIAAWTAVLGQTAVQLGYARSDFSAQVRPTLAALPSPAGFELAFIGLRGQPLDFAAPDFVAPAAPVLSAPAATVLARFENSQIRQGGPAPVPKHFIASVRQILPTPAQIFPLTIASWLTNDAWLSVHLQYAFSSSAAPTFAAAIAQLPRSVDYVLQPPPNAQPLDYALSSIVEPDKTLPTVGFSLFSWRGEDSYVPKSDWYVMGDTLTGPAQVATLKQAYPSAIPGAPALASRYEVLSSTFAAPSRFGIVQIAPPTIASWTATEGKNAVVLQYARPDWSAPAKFGIIVAAPITIANWLPTIGEKAVVLRYEAASWTAPAKFGLVQIPAVPTIGSWSSTSGAAAVSLRYAPSEVVNQVRPTLATLPTGLALSEPAANAQPQSYAAVAWSAPFDFFESQGPFVGVERGFTIVESLIATNGVTTSSAMIALNVTIIGIP